MYKRSEYQLIKHRIEEPRKFIQVVMGPRQVGKSTVVKQVLQDLEEPFLFFSADDVPTSNNKWVANCWESARSLMSVNKHQSLVLVIDEIQKITNWSESVKKEWDSDTFHDINIKVVLLGSSRVLLEKGLSESLAGRFEEIRMAQWTYAEMRDCFGLSLDQYIFYGGFPGAATLIDDEDRFQQYIQSAIIDATINKDIILDTPIAKPALLKQTFELSAAYSGQILSYNKIMGQLQNAGNTTTIANYLRVLDESGLVRALNKFTYDLARQRGSIPKLQVYNNALKTVFCPLTFEKTLMTRDMWGHIFESAIGAHIASQAFVKRFDVFYWRNRNDEVDFVLRKKGQIVAIEVKSNSVKSSVGLSRFKDLYPDSRTLIVGEGGFPAEDFLSTNLTDLF